MSHVSAEADLDRLRAARDEALAAHERALSARSAQLESLLQDILLRRQAEVDLLRAAAAQASDDAEMATAELGRVQGAASIVASEIRNASRAANQARTDADEAERKVAELTEMLAAEAGRHRRAEERLFVRLADERARFDAATDILNLRRQ